MVGDGKIDFRTAMRAEVHNMSFGMGGKINKLLKTKTVQAGCEVLCE